MIDHRTPIVEIERPRCADDVQRLYAAHGQACLALSCGNSATFDQFAALMGPGVPASILRKPFGKGGISTCVLACRGQARRVGLAAPYVLAVWVPGRPGQDEESWYRSQNAWVDARHCDPVLRPELGHEVYIGCGSAGEQYDGCQHAFRILRRVDDDIFESADGGSVDASGLQCVAFSRKQWVVRDGHSWLVNAATGLGRRVYGWAMPELCSHEGACLAPVGWESFE